MISLAAYKVLHVLGVALVFTALGGLLLAAGTGAPAAAGRKLAGMLHGIGLVILLVTGFGALARLGFSGGFPLWVWLKLALWLVLGGVIVLIRRAPQLRTLLWIVIPLLGAAGAYLAIYKPS